jgi:non-specific serine/threonine protein kinase
MTTAYKFSRFELRPGTRQLLADGQPLALGARAFDLLLALVEAGGERLAKDVLLDRVWPGLVVEESNLHVQVSGLRKLIGAEAIVTVAALGYRFALPVQVVGEVGAGAALPAERSVFIGRESLLAQAQQRLDAWRLVTLIGIGGSGKTRLALKLAAAAASVGDRAVCWVDLAALTRPEQLTATLAAAVRCKATATGGNAELAEALAAHLRPQPMLLVLDNCEHLLDAVAQLSDLLLAAAPQLRLLATSREALGLAGESVLAVRPLELPAEGADEASVAASEAVRLFSQCALLAMPGFSLQRAGTDTVAAICRRLDGIPLALELAAAQLRLLSPPQLLELLDQHFGLLVGAQRAMPRQQTLQAVIAWSHDRLLPAQRLLLRALAECSAGCDLAMAQALVAPEIAPMEVLANLSRLVEQSLISAEHGSGPVRYRMLETVRQFVLHLPQDAELGHGLRLRHAQHCKDLAEAHDLEVQRHGQGAASLARLDANRDNLLLALAWCNSCERDAPQAADIGLRLVAALWHYWSSRGLMPLGLKLTDATLARAAQVGRAQDRVHLQALVSTTQLHWWTGRLDMALQLALQQLPLALALNHAGGVAGAHWQIGAVTLALGNTEEAASRFNESLQVATAAGDEKSRADALNYLSMLAATHKDYDKAALLSEEVLAIRRRSGHGFRIVVALLNGALLAIKRQQAALAHSRLQEAATLMPKVGSQRLEDHYLQICAELADLQSEAQASVQLRAAWTVQRQLSRMPMSPQDRDELHEALQRARQHLSEAEFEAAWAAGVTLSAQQAFAWATGWLDDTAVSRGAHRQPSEGLPS